MHLNTFGISGPSHFTPWCFFWDLHSCIKATLTLLQQSGFTFTQKQSHTGICLINWLVYCIVLHSIPFCGWQAPCLVTWQWILTNGVSLWVSPHTYTHKVLQRGQDFWLHFSALLVLPNCHLYPPPHSALPLFSSSVFVLSNTKHWWRTEKDTAENTRVKSWQHATWQLHSAKAHWKHYNMPRQLRGNLQLNQQFKCDCKFLFHGVTISNQMLPLALIWSTFTCLISLTRSHPLGTMNMCL